MELKPVNTENLKPHIREFNNGTLYKVYAQCKLRWLCENPRLINYDLIFAGVDLRYVLSEEDIEIILDMMLQEMHIRGNHTRYDSFGAQTYAAWFGDYETLEELNANIQ
jgi:hypothetical protein